MMNSLPGADDEVKHVLATLDAIMIYTLMIYTFLRIFAKEQLDYVAFHSGHFTLP